MTAQIWPLLVVYLSPAFKTAKNAGVPMQPITTGMASSRRSLFNPAKTKSILDTDGITQESTSATFPLLGTSLPMLRKLDHGKNAVESLNQPWSQHSW